MTREVMQDLLKELEYFDKSSHLHGCAWQKSHIAKIKAVLAQPVQPANGDASASFKRMFNSACVDLGLINEALGLDPDDGGAEPILDAIAELKAAIAQPVQPPSWDEAQRVCDLPAVDEAIRNLIEDNTGDNATCLVREIMNIAQPVQPAKPVDLNAQLLEALEAAIGCLNSPFNADLRLVLRDAYAAIAAAKASQPVQPEQPATSVAASEPPLSGRWHHGQGCLVSGTIRIAKWDCDTNPPVEFREDMLDWVCEALNAAVNLWEENTPGEFYTATPQPVQPDMPAICAVLGFDPTNHHNAARCPYCTPSKPAQPVQPHLFEFWWAEHMPKATQSQAWAAWEAAPKTKNVRVEAIAQTAFPKFEIKHRFCGDEYVSLNDVRSAWPQPVQPAPAAEQGSAKDASPETMQIRYETFGNCLWHIDCKINSFKSGVMQVISHEVESSAMKCRSCGQVGAYPKGRVGTVCVPVISTDAAIRAGGKGGAS